MSDANRSALRYAREASYNVCSPVIPSDSTALGTNTLFNVRFTKEALDADKETVVSDEIRSDRMIPNIIQVGQKASGSFDAELLMQDFDDLIAASLMADYSTTISATCTVSGQTITADTGTPFAALVGQGIKFIKIASAATSGNNGVKTVVSITSTVITLASGSLSGSDTADAIDFSVNGVIALDNVTVSIVGQVVTATSGTFSTAVRGARYVKLANMATSGNNGIKKVVSCTSTVLTLAAGSVSGSDTGDVCTVACNYIRTGTTYVTHVLQKEFLDIPHYLVLTGMGVDSCEMKLEARKQGTINFGFMGYKGTSRTQPINTAAIISASANTAVNATSNIGNVFKDGSAITNPVKSMSLKIGNNLRERPIIGDIGSAQHGQGQSSVTGQLDVYFNDAAMLTEFLTHTAMSLEYLSTDVAGNIMNVFMPAVQSTKGTPDATGKNTDVMQTIPFNAFQDPTLGYQLQIDRLAA